METIAGDFLRLLSAASLPVYVLNDSRRLVFGNPAFFQWAGTDSKKLVGRQFDYHSEHSTGDPIAGSMGLCPPPEVFAGKRVHAVVGCVRPDGQLVSRHGDFFSLTSDHVDCPGVIGVLDHVDIPPGMEDGGSCSEPGPVGLHEQIRRFRHESGNRYRMDQLVGDSPAIRQVRAQVDLGIRGGTSVLIVGPPGSGREHVARTIHYGSNHETAGHLFPLECPLLDAELLQVTIASFVRRCREAEETGRRTLLLLDLDRLSRDGQAKLSGFLNLADFDLHIIATAREPLQQVAQRGDFRSDLAASLSTLVISVPPLRERPEDIPVLAQALLEQCNTEGRAQLGGFDAESMDKLVAYSWPENGDELTRIVQQSHTRAAGPLVTSAALPARIGHAEDAVAYSRRHEEKIVLDNILSEIERELIQRALARAKGNKTKAAQFLGMTRARLHRRIGQLGLE